MKQHNITIGNTQLANIESVYFKCEFENPTGSVKDRSIINQVLNAKKRGFKLAVISSSGNAAISASNYCKEANINLTAFVSYHINLGKLEKLKESGTDIIQSQKPISDAASFSLKNNAYNLRQSLDSEAVSGYQNISYELLKQIPNADAIFIPVSSGTMFVGIARGYMGYEGPALHATQTEAVHPISQQFDREFSPSSESIADGIVAKVTTRESEVIDLIEKSDGFGWVIGDDQIKKAHQYLRAYGIRTSYEGAMALAAVWKAKEKGYRYKSPVCILSGSFYG
ncbi:hypothetical protein A3D77_06940 [Candidatus Gottesmanbacteria bacterium RIFCSPHIGHO2_02_FULL_39_11]|uniref:Tryptophan synthase beta chain-like PALP domain-containing protein n=1 Tax=Candidatus Gottesmanbacteria bacterium RIFCSPHIGHO2_02_FULL_39_11 TaxID=1798382 RepID=A0A1F5ZKB7_9BACT|nr:MAG: hypothetical protein A3D77_06940 [Candidatus Gottesmanbacteria bacterium RIFCSPHIGHO2_02_FULL_39_11]